MRLQIQHLEIKDELRELLYHLKGIVEIQESLGVLLERLDSTLGHDKEAAQKTASQIEVEVYAHLAHHTIALKTPLRDLLLELYGSLEGSLLNEDEAESAGQ